jgi:hypothetical protein
MICLDQAPRLSRQAPIGVFGVFCGSIFLVEQHRASHPSHTKHAEYAKSSVMPWKFRTIRSIAKAEPARNEARLYGICLHFCPYYRRPIQRIEIA